MQLLQPFMPFITEEIYHLLKDQTDDICVKQFRPIEKFNPDVLKAGTQLKQDITAIRDARKKHEIKNIEQVKFQGNDQVDAFYSQNNEALLLLHKQTNTIYFRPAETIDPRENSKNEIIATSAERTFSYMWKRKSIKLLRRKS